MTTDDRLNCWQSEPHQFTNVLKNKLMYLRYGARQLLHGRDFKHVCKKLTVIADGKRYEHWIGLDWIGLDCLGSPLGRYEHWIGLDCI